MTQAKKARTKRSSFDEATFPFRTVCDTVSIRIEFQLQDPGVGSVLRDLTRLAGPISVETGCESCRIWMDYDDPKMFAMSIGWCSEADLNRFIRSERFLALMAILETGTEFLRLFVSDRRRIRLPNPKRQGLFRLDKGNTHESENPCGAILRFPHACP